MLEIFIHIYSYNSSIILLPLDTLCILIFFDFATLYKQFLKISVMFKDRTQGLYTCYGKSSNTELCPNEILLTAGTSGNKLIQRSLIIRKHFIFAIAS